MPPRGKWPAKEALQRRAPSMAAQAARQEAARRATPGTPGRWRNPRTACRPCLARPADSARRRQARRMPRCPADAGGSSRRGVPGPIP
eukprot:4530854-Alexandrium_andersonii.AAC.1